MDGAAIVQRCAVMTSISEPVSVNDLRHEEVVASLREVVGVPEEELAGVPAGFRRVPVARQRHLEHPRAAATPVRHVESYNTMETDRQRG